MRLELIMFIEENSKPNEKLKAWYLFTEDFVAGTQHLTNEQVGIYIRLLCWNWNKRCIGIPKDEMTYHRIASCITDNEKISCTKILNEFFHLVDEVFQNERQLQEYLFITRRIEASKQNGRLGGRPKKPRPEPKANLEGNLDKSPLPLPHTPTIKPKTNINKTFSLFWNKVSYKIGKGASEKNYAKLEKDWIGKPEVLADMYNKYYNSLEDKKFAKHPAFWLSDKRYLDEAPSQSNDRIDEYAFYTEKFVEIIQKQKPNSAISKIAQSRSDMVKKAINENKFTRDEAIEYLDMGSWL